MKEKKQEKMTIDTLAVIIKKEFDNVNDRIDGVETRLNDRIDGVETRLNDRIDGVDNKIDNVEQSLRKEMRGIEKNLREEFITSSDKIIGKLEIMREEHAASFGLYKELEQKVFTLEQRVDELSKQMKQLQLKLL